VKELIWRSTSSDDEQFATTSFFSKPTRQATPAPSLRFEGHDAFKKPCRGTIFLIETAMTAKPTKVAEAILMELKKLAALRRDGAGSLNI